MCLFSEKKILILISNITNLGCFYPAGEKVSSFTIGFH